MSDDTHHGGMKIDAALVRELAHLLADSDLSEIEVEDGHRKIRVARHAPVIQQTAYAPAPVAASLQPAPTAPATPVEAPVEHHADAVKSPMVGTCYLSPEPGAAPFKGVGDTVKEGETVLIIEAMKVMNSIAAPKSGTLKAMLVENGQPVEYDQPLFVIA